VCECVVRDARALFRFYNFGMGEIGWLLYQVV